MHSTESDNGVRLLALRCYALQTRMAEAERLAMEREFLGDMDCPLLYGQLHGGKDIVVDGWIMPILEVQRIDEARDSIATSHNDYYNGDGYTVKLDASHLRQVSRIPLFCAFISTIARW